MRSARLFFPLSIILFMKRVRVRLPKRGSGGTSRLITRARRGMDSPQSGTSLVQAVQRTGRGRERRRAVRASTYWVAQRPIACPQCRGQTRYVSAREGLPHEAGYLAAALGALAPYFDRPCLRSLTPPAS